MNLCLAAKRRPGPRVELWLWEQQGLDLEGMRTAAWEAEHVEGVEETDSTETVAND